MPDLRIFRVDEDTLEDVDVAAARSLQLAVAGDEVLLTDGEGKALARMRGGSIQLFGDPSVEHVSDLYLEVAR